MPAFRWQDERLVSSKILRPSGKRESNDLAQKSQVLLPCSISCCLVVAFVISSKGAEARRPVWYTLRNEVGTLIKQN